MKNELQSTSMSHLRILLPSVFKVSFRCNQNHIAVLVVVKGTDASFISNLTAVEGEWDLKKQCFQGLGVDAKNEFLCRIKMSLLDVYKDCWGRGEVTAEQVVTVFKRQYSSFVISPRDDNYILEQKRAILSEIEHQLSQNPGRSKFKKEVLDEKVASLKNKLSKLDTRLAARAVKRTKLRRGPLTIHRIIVLFVIRKARLNKSGLCPIECRVRVNGVTAPSFSTAIHVSPKTWDAKLQCIVGDEEQTEKLINLREGLTSVYNEYRKRGKVPTPESVIDGYFNNTQDYDKRMALDELFHIHLKDLKQAGRSKSTLTRYERVYRYFEDYSQLKYVDEVRSVHVKGFWKWMKHIKGYSQDYANKSVQCLYGPFDVAISHQIISNNPLKGIRLEWEGKIDLTCLDHEELDRLKNTAFSDKLQKVADSFLFMCYTGLHVGDYQRITDANIKSNLKAKWIEYDRQKTGKPAIIPLHPVASALIRKYGSVSNLPRISCQKSNDYLKLIAEKIETEKVLTNKVARKTFTDMSINHRGMSFEAVAGMLGHTSTKFVRVYGKVRHQRILSEWKA
ncbi:site-specific integrase [Dyadobacter crusticola]|uniref:site-specific integrase n=1 Tax=Dyadobacter crusticola TaxID=292407 RepID=UPI0004E112DF|nr:site-specific integrase [Dyadobacter crusticola]